MDFNEDTNFVDFNWKPRVLVLGPGGVKGFKMLGFLSPLEDYGLLDDIDTFCGVSVGSIISLLLICGYNIREIVGEAVKLDIFKQVDSFNFASVIQNKGLISNEPIRRLLTKLVVEKFGSVPTLYGLYMSTGKSLVSTTLNVTDEKCLMLNPIDHPDVSCVDAVMFSMNIPFIFYQLIYNDKVCADGALANPYPIDYFDDDNTNILGVYMKTIHGSSTDSSITYYHKIINSLMDQRRSDIISQSSDKCVHIGLNIKIPDTFGNISIEDKSNMLIEGFNEGKEFLDKLQSGTYTSVYQKKQKYKYPLSRI